MTLQKFKETIQREFRSVEVHSHSEVQTKQEYDKRYPVLVELRDRCNEMLKEHQDDQLLSIRNQISHSIRTLDLAMEIGLIK